MSTLDKVLIVGRFVVAAISFIATDVVPLIAAFS